MNSAERSSEAAGAREPGGLYIHIPFCSAICPYCDFAVTVGSEHARAEFVGALCAEMTLHARLSPPPLAGDSKGEVTCFDTIYLGGGTPSILKFEELRRILESARACFPFAADTRLHFEANPEDVTGENLARWRELGVFMLSLGVQSFSDTELRFLGRRHSASEAKECIERAKEARLGVLSLDLIYGLPGQDADRWCANLEQAAALTPEHLSCYQLTVSEGTPFFKRREQGRLVELGDHAQGDLFEITHRELSASGYAAYEVSSFARAEEFRSRHNQKYWHHVPYLGVGPSAHSFDGERRWWNEKGLREYLARIARGELPVADSESLTRADLATEAVMLGLRRAEGIDLAEFRLRHGFDLAAANEAALARFREGGFLEVEPGRLRLTLPGLAIADSISAALRTD